MVDFGCRSFSRFTQSFSRFIRDVNGEKTSRYLMIFSRLAFHGLPPLEKRVKKCKRKPFFNFFNSFSTLSLTFWTLWLEVPGNSFSTPFSTLGLKGTRAPLWGIEGSQTKLHLTSQDGIFQGMVPPRRRFPCGIALARALQIDTSSANCTVKSHIFRCLL